MMKKNIVVFFIFLFFPAASLVSATEIRIRWDANPEPDLAGYKLYIGLKSRQYGAPPIDLGNVTTYVIQNLEPGRTYYMALTAYNTSGQESGFSNEISGKTQGAANTGNYAPGNVRIIPIPEENVLGVAWNNNPEDLNYLVNVYTSPSQPPSVINAGTSNYVEIPISNYFYLVEVKANLTGGRQSYISDSADWLRGNIVGDYRNGQFPLAVNHFDLMEFGSHFGKAVQHCDIPEGANSITCPAPTNLQMADLNGDGIIDGFDLILLGLNYGLTEPQ